MTRFSTAITTPSSVRTAMAVDPSCRQAEVGQRQCVGQAAEASGGGERWSQAAQPTAALARTLIASIAYSTWKSRPSGLQRECGNQ